ncbi:MAG: hypothetical protein K0B15_14065 [Lentimicrobium sp.]|nr:hypothetical protein [Lentimicrobium sp.]
MKTLKCLSIALLAGSFLFTACTKDEVVTPSLQQNSEITESTTETLAMVKGPEWIDSFNSAEDFAAAWSLNGTPQPCWIMNACGRKGLVENRGISPWGSYAVSKAMVSSSYGYCIESEVCINVLSNEGIVVCPEIGVSVSPGISTTGISMRLMYIGKDVPHIPPQFQNKTFVVMKAYTQSGKYVYSGRYTFPVDIISGTWHKMSIIVDESHYVTFKLDNNTIWRPHYKLNSAMLRGNHVVLGHLSPEPRAHAYHDYVKVTYPPYE